MTAVQPTLTSGDAEASLRTRRAAGSGRPLRILHVVNHFSMGGAENGIRKLLVGLDSSLFEQEVCAIRGYSAEFCAGTGREVAVHVPDAASGKLMITSLARIMRTRRPDIVHSRNWGAIESVIAARMASVPVAVHSEHGYELDMLEGSLPLRRRMMRRFVYGRADAVCTVTNDLRSYHAKQAWWNPERMRVLYNGVDTDRFCPNGAARSATRKALGISENDFVVGCVSRLVPIKDHPTLLRSASALRRQGVAVKAMIVGDGPELSNLRAIAESLPNLKDAVLFTGATTESAAMMNAMDVFVLPSISEGMSNTLLEAAAVGLPSVATKVGGNPEVVVEGETGLLFTPRDELALTGLLSQLQRDPATREAMSRNARKHAVANFSFKAMMSRYTDLYLELARAKGLCASDGAYVRN